MMVVLVLTVFVDVVTAVGVGIVMASLCVRQGDGRCSGPVHSHHASMISITTCSPLTKRRLFRQCNGRAAILHLSGAMSFGAANEMMRRIVAVRPVDVLIIDLTDVPSVDGSAALTLEEIMQRALEADQEILLSACSSAWHVYWAVLAPSTTFGRRRGLRHGLRQLKPPDRYLQHVQQKQFDDGEARAILLPLTRAIQRTILYADICRPVVSRCTDRRNSNRDHLPGPLFHTQ